MKYFSILLPFTAVLSLLVFPLLIGDSNINSVAIDVILLTGAAVSWNIFSGYTGYISLGHATYAGLGAYVLALACQDWHIPGGWGPFLLLPLAGLIAGAFAIPLGWVALHAERYTFLIITIAIFFIFQLLAYNLQGFTGGSGGIFLPIPDWSPDLLNLPFYFVAWTFLLFVMLLSWWIRHSKFGLGLLAIRDDEDRVRGLGIRTRHYKLGAYVLSAALIGIEGAIAIYFLGFVNPSIAFDKSFDLTIVSASFLGGIGTVLGPIVGGLLFAPIQTFLNQQFGVIAIGLDQILFGIFLLVIILLLPEGVVPTLSKRWQKWQALHPKKQFQTELQETSSSSASIILAAPLLTGVELIDDVEVQGIHNGSILMRQAVYRKAWFYEQPSMRHRPAVVLYNARDRRLVPITEGKSLPSSERASSAPVVSWRCPGCRKPFVLRGGICYCPRCGITRQLTDGNQPILPSYPST